MKQVFQNPKSGKLHIEDITTPLAKRGGVLVQNEFSVISAGTERGIIELSKKGLLAKAKERPDYVQKFFMLAKTKGISAAWRVAQSKLATDIALGYSSAGTVISVGEDVEEFKAGDKVACAGQNYASHAEQVFVPKNLCVKIPDGVTTKEASFVTVGSIAMQGIRQAHLSQGERVAVIGLGLLGQLAVRMLKAYGNPVIGFDINPEQVQFAKNAGMDEGVVIGKDDVVGAVQKFTDGRGVDAVLVYASAKTDEPLKLAVQVARDRGRVVEIGNIIPNIPWRDFYSKDLSFNASRSYGPGRYDRNYEEGGHDYPIGYVRWTEKRNMEEFLRLIADKKISVQDLITRTFLIGDAEEAYKMVFEPKGLIHGIVLSYPKVEQTNIIHLDGGKIQPMGRVPGVVRVGLIGVGSFTNSTILPHLKEIKGVEIRAVCHTQGLPAKNLGKEWGSAYVTSDYRRLIEDRDIDLIICATRHSSHATIAKAALAANKNLYMEKPLALNEKDLREVIDVMKKSKGRVVLGFNRRYSTHFIEAKKEFANCQTPLTIFYRINVGPLDKDHWSYEMSEGGRIVGEGCHFIDALQYITGSLPKRISIGTVPAGGAIAHEENFSLTIEYENGSLGTVAYSALGNFRLPKEYIEIYGGGNIMVIDNFKSAKIIGPSKTKKLNLWHQDKGYTREMETMINAIRSGGPSPMTPDELLASHLTIFKVMEAVKTGKTIELHFERGEQQ